MRIPIQHPQHLLLNVFNKYNISAEIYTASLASLYFHKDWKKAQIIVVPKTGKALKRGQSSKPIIPGRILVFMHPPLVFM